MTAEMPKGLGPRLLRKGRDGFTFQKCSGGRVNGSRLQVTVVLPLRDRVRLRVRAWCCHERCREDEGAAMVRVSDGVKERR